MFLTFLFLSVIPIDVKPEISELNYCYNYDRVDCLLQRIYFKLREQQFDFDEGVSYYCEDLEIHFSNGFIGIIEIKNKKIIEYTLFTNKGTFLFSFPILKEMSEEDWNHFKSALVFKLADVLSPSNEQEYNWVNLDLSHPIKVTKIPK